LFYLLCLLFVSHHHFKGAKILTTITTNSSRSLSIHLSIIYRSSSSSNETDANRACTNIHQRKGTTSIQSPRERRLKTCQKTGTARCAARPSQIHRQTSRWLRTKPRLRVWNEQYDRRRKVKIDLRRFGFILCVLLGWIFVRIKKKKKRKGERKTKRALFFLLWNVASSSSCLLDCTRALLIILSIATTHTAHI